MKGLNNYVTAATLLAVWEAVLAAAGEGIAPRRAVAVLNGGSARSASSAVKFPRYVLSRRYDSGGSLAHMARDLRVARRMAPAAARRGLLRPVAALWEAAAARRGPVDHCLIGREVARRLGLSLPPALRPRRSPA
jgi:3-hydroxyisobutyrate dehydrogenase-like beta-hydroxyacid dehydrogenase